ncbi:hypothetical protein ACU4IU_12585 [Brevibacterium sp. CSND-B09]|uniref:hypothetical protein n=1 Tax=Brevibacterium sp. CSND-B09 TaxID=3462571 RepID=UPI00406A5F9D
MIAVNTGSETIKLGAAPEHVTIEKAKLIIRDDKGKAIAQFRKWEHWYETH